MDCVTREPIPCSAVLCHIYLCGLSVTVKVVNIKPPQKYPSIGNLLFIPISCYLLFS